MAIGEIVFCLLCAHAGKPFREIPIAKSLHLSCASIKSTDEARRRIEYELDLEEASVNNRAQDGGGRM
jgi:hypothetical protein